MDFLVKEGNAQARGAGGPRDGAGQTSRGGIGIALGKCTQRNVGGVRILNGKLPRSRTAIVERSGVGVALFHSVNEAIGADAVVEHPCSAAYYQFAVHLVSEAQARGEVT